VPTIEEEDAQMGEQVTYAGDPGDYYSQYTGYHGNDDACDGTDCCVEGEYYFDDG
jgi:hypothetical protein